LIVRLTDLARIKIVGYSDPIFKYDIDIEHRIKGTLGITG